MTRVNSTRINEAWSFRPPAWTIRSSMVVLSAYWKVPGFITWPEIVNVRSLRSSSWVGMKRTSSFLRGMSATVPFMIPWTSAGINSRVLSAFRRWIRACWGKASSVKPSAASTKLRTELISPFRLNCPGRKTAPLISTMFSKRSIIPSTLTASPSSTLNVLMSNSLTLWTE